MGKLCKRRFKDYDNKKLDKTHPGPSKIEGCSSEGQDFETMKL